MNNLLTAISAGLLVNKNLIQDDNFGISRDTPYNTVDDCDYTKNEHIFYIDEKET